MKLIMLFKRKPGLTPEQFREYYEAKHVPLALRLLPFLGAYTRNYICHDTSYRIDSPDVKFAQLNIDAVTEISFHSKDDYDGMLRALADPAILGTIVADEEQFMDRSATVVFHVDEQRTPDLEVTARK